MQKSTRDAIIIGAGIIGNAIAFELGKRGYRTLNIDRLPAAGHGSTSNSCAIVRAHYSSHQGVAMAHEGFSYWQDWNNYLGSDDERGIARYAQCGVVLLKSATDLHQKALRHYDALGVRYEEWDAGQVRARYPMIDMGEFWPPRRPDDPEFAKAPRRELRGAVFTPNAGYVPDPLLATHNLQLAAESLGGRFMFRTEVTAIRRAGARVSGVTLSDGREIDSQVVVNVAGPHSYLVNRMAGVAGDMNIGTRALRHEVHYVPAPQGHEFEADGSVISDGDQGIYFRPATGNHILVGSEDPPCDDRAWVEHPDRFDRCVTEAQWEAQVYRLARRLPGLRIPSARTGIVDLYDVSDDWLPIYDRSELDGFYMAIGTSGNQFKNAPVVGRLMAELIEQVERGHDHDAHPVHVKAFYTGADLDAGFYSRLREINPESSFSVTG
jgi:sarcosine oxidase, subunit beta